MKEKLKLYFIQNLFINNVTMTVRIALYFEFHINFCSIICDHYLKSLKRLIFAKVKYSLILHKLSVDFQLKSF